jgi:arginine repressor
VQSGCSGPLHNFKTKQEEKRFVVERRAKTKKKKKKKKSRTTTLALRNINEALVELKTALGTARHLFLLLLLLHLWRL